MDLTSFAREVGGINDGPVAIAGLSTRGGALAGCRVVAAPTGIDSIQPDEMIVHCSAGTAVVELNQALAAVGQCVSLPASGTVGGALARGLSDTRRLGYGPLRDALLQAHYVSAAGHVVKAGGPTVKNVSGFDLCRLLVGSQGTLGFLGQVILRTRPLAAVSQWFSTAADPWITFSALYRPVSVLWDGTTTWALLEGHASDVAEQAALAGLTSTDGAPALPGAHRWSVAPSGLRSIAVTGAFVAEIGVGVVHRSDAAQPRQADASIAALHRRLKYEFDPTLRLNPGVEPLSI